MWKRKAGRGVIFMKVTWYVLVGLVVAAFLIAAPVHAASVAVSDEDLAGISGKEAEAIGAAGVGSAISTGSGVYVDEGFGNSMIASYDWTDTHAADASDHKGANDISGSDSVVQQNVVATDNTITWGAASLGGGVTGSPASDSFQAGAGSAVQHIGGF